MPSFEIKIVVNISFPYRVYKPARNLSMAATVTTEITTEFEVLSHQAGTNVVNQTRLEMNANNPSTRPWIV